MDLCEKISAAKCCVVEVADAYVRAVTFGNDTDGMRDELFLLNGYIHALERYDTSECILVKKTVLLTDNNILLADDNKILSLGALWVEKEVNPDDINCLTKDDVCNILEQISYSCESCVCGC